MKFFNNAVKGLKLKVRNIWRLIRKFADVREETGGGVFSLLPLPPPPPLHTHPILNRVKKFENIQYKACIAVTGAIQGTSREHLYHELCLESLGDQRWCHNLTFFIKS